MAKKKLLPAETTDLAGMAKKIEGESDRGVALIIAAWVDDALGDLLKAYLVQDGKAIEEMFKQMAPLSTFSAKIKAAYLVGLIDKRLLDNLDTIREIRNDFAHSRIDLTFQAESVRARCMNLMYRNMAEASGDPAPPGASPPSPRKAFVATGLVLAGYFIDLRGKLHPVEVAQPSVFDGYGQSLAGALKKLIVAKAREMRS
jgi:hypothetical protein